MVRVGLFLALCLVGPACAGAPPRLEIYGKLPTIEDARISPDGARYAMIVTDGDQRFVSVYDTKSRSALRTIKAGMTKLRGLAWAGNDNVIIAISKDTRVEGLEGGKQEWFLAVDLNTRTWTQQGVLDRIVGKSGGENLNAVVAMPVARTVDGKPHVFAETLHFPASGGKGSDSLYDYDPATGVTALSVLGEPETDGWLVDKNGKLLAESFQLAKLRRWGFAIRNGDDLKLAKVFEADIEHPVIMGLGRDGKSVLLDVGAEEKDGSAHDRLVEMASGDKDWGPPVIDRDIEDLIFDPSSSALIGYSTLVGDEARYQFFDAKDQAAWNAIVKTYPGCVVALVSMSADHRKMVILVDSPTETPAYALVDIDKQESAWLGANYQEASDAVAPRSSIAFKAADGLALTGYLTTPKGVSAKNLPLIVFPHGGPAARDEPTYDWWAQAMASRGYAVLQVNYRGSSGFGWDFMKAGFGQFGRKMQTDLSDGVRYLAAQGTIDPKRVCIVGASYGGYAALAGATIDTGVYRCAVSVAGLSDLKRDINWSANDDRLGIVSKRYWLRFMGVDKVSDPKLNEISPIRLVDKVTIPILLIHGKDDTVVDFSQSQIMYDALKKANKDVELVVLPHENHHLLTGATRLLMLQATMAFLAKNNPAD